MYLNLTLTFLVSGIWHGAGLRFLVWGMMHAAYQITGDMTRNLQRRAAKILRLEESAGITLWIRRIWTFLCVMAAWILFRAESLRKGLQMLWSMFRVRNLWIFTNDSLLTMGLEWKEWVVFAAKLVCFFILLVICYYAYCRWITPKFFTDTDWPTTTTFAGFYDLDRDSVDVLFLGSSHGVTSFCPQEVYNRYGITSYNLSSDQQGLVTSYYWLKEALRYQTPKAVVLECYFCFPYIADEPLNTDESYTRKAVDFMRWSPVKAEAVRTICEIDGNQDAWSYYLPHLRYHERWLP